MEKSYFLYAGINGAGKTTMYKNDDTEKNLYRINSDEILTANGGDWKNRSDQAVAMKEAVRKISDCFNNGISFMQETTLTGHSILNNINKAKELGYNVEVFYVGLESSELAIERVAHRVQTGGHGINEEDIKRRYVESLENLKKIIPLCDTVTVFDNTRNFIGVAKFVKGQELYRNPCPWLEDALKGYRQKHIEDIKECRYKPSEAILKIMDKLDRERGCFTDMETISRIHNGVQEPESDSVAKCSHELGEIFKQQRVPIE